jgi:hypothetical protein
MASRNNGLKGQPWGHLYQITVLQKNPEGIAAVRTTHRPERSVL